MRRSACVDGERREDCGEWWFQSMHYGFTGINGYNQVVVGLQRWLHGSSLAPTIIIRTPS